MLFSLMIWFGKKGVQLISGVKEYVEITDKGLTIVDKDGVTRTLQADTFVSALPLTLQRRTAAGPAAARWPRSTRSGTQASPD